MIEVLKMVEKCKIYYIRDPREAPRDLTKKFARGPEFGRF